MVIVGTTTILSGGIPTATIRYGTTDPSFSILFIITLYIIPDGTILTMDTGIRELTNTEIMNHSQ